MPYHALLVYEIVDNPPSSLLLERANGIAEFLTGYPVNHIVEKSSSFGKTHCEGKDT